MKFLIHHFIIAFLFANINSEWLQIPQEILKETSTVKSNTKILATSSALDVFETTSPSPYWVEYQKERFGNLQKLNSQKFVVTGDNRLKISAQIVVSPVKTTLRPRQQIINTKMGLNVVDLNSAPPNTEHAHVEITSRKYTPGQSEETNQEEIVEAETTQQQVPTGDEDIDTDLEIFPTIQGFIGFLKSLKKDWFKKAALNINQKIKLLEMLRDNLMYAIEERFMAIWQTKKVSERKKRSLTDEASFNFPPEAALMTINFLTFAVFLIKLVLNVVNIIKSKHYKFSGFGESTTVRRPN